MDLGAKVSLNFLASSLSLLLIEIFVFFPSLYCTFQQHVDSKTQSSTDKVLHVVFSAAVFWNVTFFGMYRWGHGFESRWSLGFFRLLFSSCLNGKIYCDDHSRDLSDTGAMLYQLSYEATHLSYWSLEFFRLLLSSFSNWKIHCDDHSSLWSTTAVQIYELFHIYFTSLHSSREIDSINWPRSQCVAL